MRKTIFFDILVGLAVIAALVVGYLTYKHFRQTADNQIESTSKIAFQVFLRGVTITGNANPIKAGDDTFISIRNVPYTNLKVENVKIDSKKMIVPNPKGNPPFVLLDDYSQIFMYDIVVTILDKATITKDGPVVGGNKIKIGLPITLEGKTYKFNGTVSDVQILPETAPAAPNVPAVPGKPQATMPAGPTAPSAPAAPTAPATPSAGPAPSQPAAPAGMPAPTMNKPLK